MTTVETIVSAYSGTAGGPLQKGGGDETDDVWLHGIEARLAIDRAIRSALKVAAGRVAVVGCSAETMSGM
jgi:hypothetical protein